MITHLAVKHWVKIERVKPMVIFANDDMVTLEIMCCECHKVFSLRVKKADYERYKNGESHIQYIFPYLKPAERELLISRTCGTCWNKLFPEEENCD